MGCHPPRNDRFRPDPNAHSPTSSATGSNLKRVRKEENKTKTVFSRTVNLGSSDQRAAWQWMRNRAQRTARGAPVWAGVGRDTARNESYARNQSPRQG